MSRRVIRYRSSRPDDGPLRQRLRELAAERRRFGYRRLGRLLAREGMTPNHKKLPKVYREEKLWVRRRGGRKRALGMRAPVVLPDGPNQLWSLDFVSDTLTYSRRFRILCVVDDYTRRAGARTRGTLVRRHFAVMEEQQAIDAALLYMELERLKRAAPAINAMLARLRPAAAPMPASLVTPEPQPVAPAVLAPPAIRPGAPDMPFDLRQRLGLR